MTVYEPTTFATDVALGALKRGGRRKAGAARNYGSAMLGVAALQSVRLRRGPAPGGRWILAGIAGSFVAALVQRSGLRIHALFTHNDLYHVLQMGATALLYRGGMEVAHDGHAVDPPRRPS